MYVISSTICVTCLFRRTWSIRLRSVHVHRVLGKRWDFLVSVAQRGGISGIPTPPCPRPRHVPGSPVRADHRQRDQKRGYSHLEPAYPSSGRLADHRVHARVLQLWLTDWMGGGRSSHIDQHHDRKYCTSIIIQTSVGNAAAVCNALCLQCVPTGGKPETGHILRVHGAGGKLSRPERAERSVRCGEDRRNEHNHHATVFGRSQRAARHQSHRLQGTVRDHFDFGPDHVGGTYTIKSWCNVFRVRREAHRFFFPYPRWRVAPNG